MTEPPAWWSGREFERVFKNRTLSGGGEVYFRSVKLRYLHGVGGADHWKWPTCPLSSEVFGDKVYRYQNYIYCQKRVNMCGHYCIIFPNLERGQQTLSTLFISYTVQYSTVQLIRQCRLCTALSHSTNIAEISLWPGSNDLNEVRDREDSNNENYLCPPNHQLASGNTSTLRGETLPRPINQECSDSATRSDSLIDRQLLSRPSGPTTWGLPWCKQPLATHSNIRKHAGYKDVE